MTATMAPAVQEQGGPARVLDPEWAAKATAAGFQPLYCTRNSSGSWVPQVGTTGEKAPFGTVLKFKPPRYRPGIRVSADVVLLDVDCDRPEQPDKDGWPTIEALTARLGALPLTARLTARGGHQRSGRYAYRLPAGVNQSDLRDPGPGVELIRMGCRFSWAPGDVHPKTGTVVAWLDAAGNPLADWPRAEDLPELPAPWCTFLADNRSAGSSGLPGEPIAYEQAVAAEQRAWEEFCAHKPKDGGLRSALLTWARKVAGRLIAEGTDLASLPARIWEAMTAHPAWPTADWEPSLSEQTISAAIAYAEDNPPVLLPEGVSKFEADGYPRKELPQAGGPARGPIDESAFAFCTDADYDNPQPPPEAAYGRFGGSLALFYDTGVHWLQGESESGKSWVALGAALDHPRAAHDVVYVDYEDSKRNVIERLRQLGATRTDLRHLVYVDAQSVEFTALCAHLADTDRDYGLLVVDGVTSSLSAASRSGRDEQEVTAWADALLRRARSAIAVDHVVKSKDERAGMAIGSQAKKSVVTGTAFEVTCTEPIGRGLDGTIELTCRKDKPGGVRGRFPQPSKPTLLLAFTSDAQTGAVTLVADTDPFSTRRLGQRGSGRVAAFEQLRQTGISPDSQAELQRQMKAIGAGYGNRDRSTAYNEWVTFCSSPFNIP